MSVYCQGVCFVVTLYRTYMYEWYTVNFFCKCYILITQWCIWILINVFTQIYVHVYASNMRILILGSWFLQGHAWYTRLRRRWFGGCVLLKFWGESYVKPLSLRLMYKLYLIMDCVVVWARWTMDIGLDSSVVEHLTSNARVLGSIPGLAIYFHLYFFVFVHSSHPYYNWNILFTQITVESFGEVLHIPLVEGGSEKHVTKENR